MLINHEEVIGYHVNDVQFTDKILVCKDCISDDEYKDITFEDVVTIDQAENLNEESMVFCDRCTKEI